MHDDLFEGLDVIIKSSTAKPVASKAKRKGSASQEKLIKAKNPHDVQAVKMKHDPVKATRKSLNSSNDIITKLSAVGAAPHGTLSTDELDNTTKLMYIRSDRQDRSGNTSGRQSATQSGIETGERSCSTSLPYTLTVNDIATKLNNDVSRSQASQVLRSKIESVASRVDEIWREPSQFSTSQPGAHDSANSFSLQKTKAPTGKPVPESTNL